MYIKQTLLGFFPHSSVPQKVPFNRLIHLQPSTFCLATIRELLLQRNPQGKEFFFPKVWIRRPLLIGLYPGSINFGLSSWKLVLVEK